MKKKFKIGDRIIVVNEIRASNKSGKIHVGCIGTVIDDMGVEGYLIEFDENLGLHDGAKKGKDGHCWWVRGNDIVLVNDCDIYDLLIKQIKDIEKIYG